MSWWVYLNDENGISVKVDRFFEGGTQAIGGDTTAVLNITYNYSKFYYECLDKDNGLRWLDGKKASACIAQLQKAVNVLGTEKDNDYWKPTPGNAGVALSLLLKWAKQNPEAIFKVS